LFKLRVRAPSDQLERGLLLLDTELTEQHKISIPSYDGRLDDG
jgi:hypothetical protein